MANSNFFKSQPPYCIAISHIIARNKAQYNWINESVPPYTYWDLNMSIFIFMSQIHTFFSEMTEVRDIAK